MNHNFPFPLMTPKQPDTLHHAPLLGGEYGVTACFDSLQQIIDWQEGRITFDHGYYRFIDHPYTHELQESIKLYFELRHALTYTSCRTAMMELLDYLLLSKPQMCLTIIQDLETDSTFCPLRSLPSLQTEVRVIPLAQLDDTVTFSKNKDEIVLFATSRLQNIAESHQDLLKQLKKSRIPRVLLSDKILEPGWIGSVFEYGVFPLSEDTSVEAGVLISNVDRHMDALSELRKQKGPYLSNRNVAHLTGKSKTSEKNLSHASQQVLHKLCELEDAEHSFLYPSGMNAIASTLSLLRMPGKSQFVSLGHLYTDTYTLLTYAKLREVSEQSVFLGVHELEQLPTSILPCTAGVITETITNPLNDVPDLEAIASITKQHNLPFIVDNTIATPINCQPLHHGADLVIHSTTKYLSGQNNHSGGTILTNDPDLALRLKTHQEDYNNFMSPFEAEVLWDALRDIEDRMKRFNQSAIETALALEQHPAVAQVYYSGLPSHPCHSTAQKQLQGYSSVVSFRLHDDTLEGARKFYDQAFPGVHKAPSLGSNETLLCPYTLLAHYHETDEILEGLHLSRYLLRFSVGLEPPSLPSS